MDILTPQSLNKPGSSHEALERCDSHRLFVGGIPKHVKEPHLRKYFLQFGCLKTCRINRSGTDKSRGYGYIEFADHFALQRVFSSPAGHHVIEGCVVRLEPAFDPIARRSQLQSLGERRLYLSGIPAIVTTTDITRSICRFGSLQNITKLRRRHPFTTPPSFYCYVTMDRRSDAEELILRQTLMVGIGQGHVIKIRHFQPHSQRVLNKILHRENVLETNDCPANQTGQDEENEAIFDGNNSGFSQNGLPQYKFYLQEQGPWVQEYFQDFSDVRQHYPNSASHGTSILHRKDRSRCTTQVECTNSRDPSRMIRQSLSISQIPNMLDNQSNSDNLRFNVSRRPR